MIRLSELQNSNGVVAKQYTIEEDGTFTVKPAANVWEATARSLEIPMEDVASYLDSLNNQYDKCITLGSFAEPGAEAELVTSDKVTEGKISRNLSHFSWANSGSISIPYLDFDSVVAPEVRTQFLAELDCILEDALIGYAGHQRKTACKWLRPSSSASVKINGKVGTGLHVFIAVKHCTSELIPLIFKWAFLQNYTNKRYRITKTGTVLPDTLIDGAVGSPERIIFTAGAQVSGPEEQFELIERTCSWQRGGVIDCELAVNILKELTADYSREWEIEKANALLSDEVKTLRAAWQETQVAKRVEAGVSKKAAWKQVKSLASGIILSSESLLKDDGTSVDVVDILTDFDSWKGVGHFGDPEEFVKGRNVGMILGSEERPFMNCLTKGGCRYFLKWDYESLLDWVDNASANSVEDFIGMFLGNAELSNIQEEKIIKTAATKIGVGVVAVRAEAKSQKKEVETIAREEAKTEALEEGENILDLDATQGDIIDDYIRRLGDCKSFGNNIYSWSEGQTIWASKNVGTVSKEIRNAYNYCVRCGRVADYKALSGAVLAEEDIRVPEWQEIPGFACSDAFHRINRDTGDVEPEPYTKAHGCRFKMGIAPDYKMAMPLFNKILENVENPILFQQLFGLALSGYLPSLQAAAVLFGAGGSGKGTTCDIMTAMLPKDRLSTLSVDQFNNEVYRMELADSRINFTNEVSRKRADLTGIKEVIGQGMIGARALYSGPVKFSPRVSIVLSINKFFPLSETGPAVQRRFGNSIVKFTRRNDEQIETLSSQIIENELPAVLAWAVDGVRLYFELGLDSELSHELYSRWLTSVDPIALFIEENIVFGHKRSGFRIKRADMYARFDDFCKESGYYSIKKGEFFDALSDDKRFGVASKYQGNMCYTGMSFNGAS